MSDFATATTDPAVLASTEEHLRRHQRAIWERTDRLLAGLLLFEWLGGLILALCRSPLTWAGAKSQIHPHVIAAALLGALIVALPTFLAIRRPGLTLTRHVIAAAQMLMSALLIHLGDGRIEMHFHVFGSLAFLAFYRDWRVLVTATLVVAVDHLLRGIYAPQSVYGVLSASIWRTFEHAAWVLFENVFLGTSCVMAVREMRGIARQRALLEHSYQLVEQKVQERSEQLKNAQEELLKAARSAGMAEIATSVLHNVGNVLNSVNISATVVVDKLRQSEVASLAKVSEMIVEHKPQLASFLTTDERGKLIPDFITDLASCLNDEQNLMLAELNNLTRGVDHIKQIVAAQQSMAKKSNVRSAVKPATLFDAALRLQSSSMDKNTEIHKQIDDVPAIMLDQHKVLQILVNLISNAQQAVAARPVGQRTITLELHASDDTLLFRVTDTGMGIAPEHLSRIFAHGFTTKQNGHGFGLHGAINAAKEMGGNLSAASKGVNQGATFTLEVPIAAESVTESASCK